MTSIVYHQGPPRVTMGAAGVFKIGEPRAVDDKLAERLLKKKSIVFSEASAKPAADPGATKASAGKGGKKKE